MEQQQENNRNVENENEMMVNDLLSALVGGSQAKRVSHSSSQNLLEELLKPRQPSTSQLTAAATQNAPESLGVESSQLSGVNGLGNRDENNDFYGALGRTGKMFEQLAKLNTDFVDGDEAFDGTDDIDLVPFTRQNAREPSLLEVLLGTAAPSTATASLVNNTTTTESQPQQTNFNDFLLSQLQQQKSPNNNGKEVVKSESFEGGQKVSTSSEKETEQTKNKKSKKEKWKPAAVDFDLNSINPFKLAELEIHSVASMRRPNKFYDGKLVGINSDYIAYISKAGVRLIRQSDGMFTLLKHHVQGEPDEQPLDIALSACAPSLGGQQFPVRLATLYPSGLFAVDEVCEDDDESDSGELKTRCLVKLAPTVSKQVRGGFKSCFFNNTGSMVSLLATDVMIDFDLENLKVNQIQKVGGGESIKSYSDLQSFEFVGVYEDEFENAALGSYLPYEDSQAVYRTDGSLVIVSGNEEGMGFQTGLENERLSFMHSAMALEASLIFILAFEKNSHIVVWSGDTFKKFSELRLLRSKEVTGDSFAQIFYHDYTQSLFVATCVKSKPCLLRFELDERDKFQLKGSWKLPAVCLSMSCEQSMAFDDHGSEVVPDVVEMVMAFEDGVSLFSIPLTDQSYKSSPTAASPTNSAADAFSDVKKAKDQVTNDLISKILKEAVQNGTEEIVAAESMAAADSCQSSESVQETNALDLQEDELSELKQQKKQKIKDKEDRKKKHQPKEKSGKGKEKAVAPKVDTAPQQQEELYNGNEEDEGYEGDALAESIGPIVDNVVALHLRDFSLHLDKTLPTVIERVVQKSIDKAITKSLEKQVARSIEESLARNSSAEKISSAVTVAVSASISNLMSDNFEKVLIPAYQSATQVMFKQMQNAFQHGLNAAMADFSQTMESSLGLQSDVKAVLSGMSQQIAKAQQQQTSAIADLTKAVKTAARVSPGGTPAMTGNVLMTSPVEDLKKKIMLAVEKGEYETAFVTAFESGDPNFVFFCLSITDPKQVFFLQGHPVLSQPALLTLIQHLMLDFNSQTDMKFMWLQECLASLDPRHPLISEYCKRVLPALGHKLNDWLVANPTSPHMISVKLLVRFTNSLLQTI